MGETEIVGRYARIMELTQAERKRSESKKQSRGYVTS